MTEKHTQTHHCILWRIKICYLHIGTRIVYERAFLMNLRNSPISRTPPRSTLTIPSELLKGSTPAITRDPAKNTDKGRFNVSLLYPLHIYLSLKNLYPD